MSDTSIFSARGKIPTPPIARLARSEILQSHCSHRIDKFFGSFSYRFFSVVTKFVTSSMRKGFALTPFFKNFFGQMGAMQASLCIAAHLPSLAF
jgi:hypothetical protein